MINFSTRITEIRAYSTDGLTNIIKEVDWILEGQDGDIKYNVASTSKLQDPKPENFMPLETITQEQVLSWVANTPEYLATKAHIADYIQQKVSARNLETVPLPWAPITDIQ